MNKEEAEKLFKSKYVKDKLQAVKAGYFHEECLTMRSYDTLRTEIARQGKYLDRLYNDNNVNTRIEVAKHGFKKEILLNDIDMRVRRAVYLGQLEKEDDYTSIDNIDVTRQIYNLIKKYNLGYRILDFKKSRDFIKLTLMSPSFEDSDGRRIFNKLNLVSYDCNHTSIIKLAIDLKTGDVDDYETNKTELSFSDELYKLLFDNNYISKAKIQTVKQATAHLASKTNTFKFSEDDFLTWEFLKQRLENEGCELRTRDTGVIEFYKNSYSTERTEPILKKVYQFIHEKHSQLENATGIKYNEAEVVKALNDGLSKINEKFNKNLTISNEEKTPENVTSKCQNEGVETVNHPSHYTSGSVECIDLMVELFGVEAVKGFCLCNSFKYLYRNMNKNGLEDIKKSKWYQEKYIELNENTNKK